MFDFLKELLRLYKEYGARTPISEAINRGVIFMSVALFWFILPEILAIFGAHVPSWKNYTLTGFAAMCFGFGLGQLISACIYFPRGIGEHNREDNSDKQKN